MKNLLTRKQFNDNFFRQGLDPNGNIMPFVVHGGANDSYDMYLSKAKEDLLQRIKKIEEFYKKHQHIHKTKSFQWEGEIYDDEYDIENMYESEQELKNENSNDEKYYLYKTEPNACAKCLALDGQVFETKPEFPHPNCKCEINEISQEQANARKEKHAKDIEQRDKAIEHLNSKAGVKSDGKCGQFVREAAQAGLDYKTNGTDRVIIEIPTVRPGNKGASACDFGPSYKNAGFDEVYKYEHNPKDIDMNRAGVQPSPKGYDPKKGDVVIFQNTTNHSDGHAAMYDGKQWVSDYVQIDMWGGGIRKEAPSYVIYRNPKWNDWK